MPFPATFVNLQDAVIDKLRLDPDLDRDKVKDWINAAYYEACSETEFYLDSVETQQLQPGVSVIGVPALLTYLNYITSSGQDGSNYGTMDLVGLDVILDKRSYGGATAGWGAPSLYAYKSGGLSSVIEIWPSATGGEILSFYGGRLPPALLNDTDQPMIPEPYGSNILEFGADAQASEFKQNYIMLSTYQQESAYWLSRFRAFQNNRPGNKVQQFQIEHSRARVSANNSADIPANW